MKKEPTYVTKVFLPDKKKLFTYIDKIYQNKWVTNDGPFVKLLEKKLSELTGVKHVILVANGTLALQLSFKLLRLKGSVITTPFSFIATSSSLVWEGLKPVFVDIRRDTLNINEKLIEQNIKKDTTAILPVHIYGIPSEIEAIQEIAQKNNLKVIYDAAHAFGVNYKGKSIFKYGDISICSFHATKIFHTIEGGAIFTEDDDIAEEARRMRNFGYYNGEILSLGINAKMNEFEAIMGLILLEEFNQILEARKKRWQYYYEKLKNIVELPRYNTEYANQNFSYFPVILPSEDHVIQFLKESEKKNIYPRRYFYPSLNTLSFMPEKKSCPVAEDISRRIVALPFSHEITQEVQDEILETLENVLKN